MKIVKSFSTLSVPFYLPYGKVLVSPRNVYVYDYTLGRFFCYSHTEFYKYFTFCRNDFVKFVRAFFPQNNVNYKL